MSSIDLLFDPLIESVLQHGGAHVGDPLLGRLGQLEIWIREVFEHVTMINSQELLDLLETETIIPT